MKPNEHGLKELRILAVDDEESNLLLVRRILEREGYTRVEGHNGIVTGSGDVR